MFRYEIYPEEIDNLPEKEQQEVILFLSKRTSRAMLFGLEVAFGLSAMNGTFDETILEDTYQRRYHYSDFFSGFGQYYHATDEKSGRDFLRRKLIHMRGKLLDGKGLFPFDLFEEKIFDDVVCEVQNLKNHVDKSLKKRFYSRQDQEDVCELLHEKLQIKKKKASQMSKTFCRVYRMTTYSRYGDHLFKDRAFVDVWFNGFVEALRPGGAMHQRGYSYADKLDLFSGTGMRLPQLLTQEEKAGSQSPEHFLLGTRFILDPRHPKSEGFEGGEAEV